MTCKTAFLSLIFSFLFLVFILSLSKDVSAFNLPDTGQTKCYRVVSPYDEIPCAGTGQDGEYNINPLSYTDNGNGTVTDDNTGLIWQKCSAGQNNDPTCSGTALTYNWYKASGTYHSTYNPASQNVCGDLTTGGYTDWRLPAKKELISIVDYSIPYPGPTINPVFTNTNRSEYWSSTSRNQTSAWGVYFNGGYVGSGSKTNSYYVRCVRGEELNFGNYINNYDGTITDTSTKLMWQQGETVTMTWAAALNFCENLELPPGSGQADWRLPNIKELESITDDTRSNPAINTTLFPNAHASFYWSSSAGEGSPYNAWYVGFSYGFIGSLDRDNLYYVRCVNGPVELFDYYCDDDSDTYIDSAIDGTCTGGGCVPVGCQTAQGDDCNDSNLLEHPNQTWYKDNDNDLYASGDIIVQCSRPAGYKVTSELTATSGDCNDSNAAVNPGATEICDGIDNDCNGLVDEGCSELIANLVTDYYNSILNRAPEPGGAEGWTSEIQRIDALGIDIKEGFIALGKLFFNSSEYLNMGTTNSAYITDLYETFLGRTPSQGEIDGWAGELAGGLTRNLLLNYFIFSAEFMQYMNDYFGDTSVRPEYNLVNDLYRSLLSRLPDDGGFNYWLGQMQTAQCNGDPQAIRDLTSEIALLFLNSEEYANRNTSNSEFIEDLYNGILRRGAELSGYLYWLGELNGGAYTRAEMLQLFVDSPEFQARVQQVIDAGCAY